MKLWDRQAELLNSIANHPRVACRSGHKVSKSVTAAIAALWFYSTYDQARVIFTATTNAQVRNITWREVRLRANRAKIWFPQPAELPGIGLKSEDGSREIIGLSTNEKERMQGFSSPNMLFIVDEASGVDEGIFEAIEGNRAGGARILMLGNPTQPVGTFYDAFHSKREFWHTLHISSREAGASRPHIPGTATTDWCEEKLREWGPDDPRYHVRVLGNFADSAESAVCPLGLVLKAQSRYDETEGLGRLELGVDVARFGDDETVIIARRGRKVVNVTTRSKLGEHEVAATIVGLCEQLRLPGDQPPLIKVDACGVGLGVESILRQQRNINVMGVYAGDTSSHPEEYTNKRAELWFGITNWLRDGGSIPKDPKLESDILSAQYDFDAKNRLRVEKKDDIKKRLRRSPDRADALALAIHSPMAKLVYDVSNHQSRSVGGYRWKDRARGF